MRDLGDGILLRPLRAGDGAHLAEACARNRAHLEPWDPVRPVEFYRAEGQERSILRSLADVADGRMAAFVLADADERIVGRVNLNNIVRGSFLSADLGYWIDSELTGRGIMSHAVGSVCEHARDDLALHRVQAGTLVHNIASQRVLSANGFERIGLARHYLRIAGAWQDHVLFQRILSG
nr:GNAT family protein [Microbacterium esteraromaticum]